jgi:hypothetical protein
MSMELLRVIFPRWNFFDRTGYQLVLEIKQTGAKGWLPISFNAARTMGGLFVNPEVTRLHAEMSLLENFVSDVQNLTDAEGKIDPKHVHKLTSFKMVRSLVMSRLMVTDPDSIRFRISAKAGEESVALYVSESVEATP